MQATDLFVTEPEAGDGTRAESPAAPISIADMAPHGEAEAHERSGAPAQAVDRQAALRALRNLEATEARLARNAKRELEEARGKLIQELLPVLDNLDRTLRAAHAAHSDPAMLQGVRLVRQQLESILRGYGVERIEALDQRFDPGIHDAIGVIQVSDPRRHGMVVEQVEPGYRFGDRLLRPARVAVGKLVASVHVAARPAWR